MRDEKTALTLCAGCPKLCNFSCPVADAEKSEAATPWGKMLTMKLTDSGRLPRTAETMAAAYKCLNCRLSEEVCELDNPVAPVLDTHRVIAFQTGLAPAPVYSYCKNFQKFDNPYGVDLQAELAKRLPRLFGGRSGRVYFAGCTEIARGPGTIENALTLLKRVGRGDFGLFSEPEQCCGYPLFAAGDWENFKEIAEVMANTLRDYSLVVSGAPACLYTMQTLYKAAGYPVKTRLVHITEFLDEGAVKAPERLRSGRTGRRAGPTVAYHDPCYLGRYRRTFDAPRRLIQAATGHPPIEFRRSRELSYCCGAGGLLPVSFPETAGKITKNRLEEFRETGADLLVSACPSCVNQFRSVSPKICVSSLTDLLAVS